MPQAWPRRPRLVAGNWKMNKTPADGASLIGELRALMSGTGGSCTVAVCPPFPALHAAGVALRGSNIRLGAQNLYPEPHGAFTGEVSGAMLVAAGCQLVIVGHSERRHVMGEDDELIARKLRAALRDGLTPILCVGETLQQREDNRTADVLVRQVRAAHEGLTAEQARATVIAYEPVWAIGTGKVATTEQARDAHKIVRETLSRVVPGKIGDECAVLYGGSVTPDNAPALFNEEDVDGALVGGASLEAAKFWRIVAAAAVDASRRGC